MTIDLDTLVSATTTAAAWAGTRPTGEGLDSTASRQWASRPDDERYTSLSDLSDAVTARRDRSTSAVVNLRDVRIDSAAGMRVFHESAGLLNTSNHAFGQLCRHVGAPPAYLRTLPDRLAADCLNAALRNADSEVMTLTTGDTLRGITGPKYGRIWDADLVTAIRDVTDAGAGRWQVPTAFKSATSTLASVDPTTESTTLYSGDRDTFLFLVDEKNPIQAGTLANGDPDLYYRGFYAWNGECGDVSNGCGTFLYRYVCMNRNIWGQRGFQKFVIKHTSGAAARFAAELIPALTAFVDGSATGIESGLLAAKQAKAARDDLERARFMEMLGLGPNVSRAILDRIVADEGHPAESVWDFVQGVTSVARAIQNQDQRVQLETVGAKLMRSFIG